MNFEEQVDAFVRDVTKVGSMPKSQVRSRLSDLFEGYAKVLRAIPMGVSQWRNHGEKYGYWDYFKQKNNE